MKLNITPNDKQLPFLRDKTNRALLFLAGRGSGKTFAGSAKAIQWMAREGTEGMIIAPTYKQMAVARKTLFDVMRQMTTTMAEQKLIAKLQKDRGLPPLVKTYEKDKQEIYTITNSLVYLRSATDPDSLRGYSLDWFWHDEPAMSKEEAHENSKLCLRRNTCGYNQYWLTTTPKGFNWLYNKRNELEIYTATTYDNRSNLPDEYIENLPTSGNWALQEIGGEFVEMEGLVLTPTDYSIFTPTIDTLYSCAAGLDFGYANPSAIVYVADVLTKELGRAKYVYREVYVPEVTTDDIYNLTLSANAEWTNFKTYFADPSLPGNIEALRRRGLRITKANNDILYGIDKIKRSTLIIDPSCENLVAELKQWVWDDKRGKPVKGFDHACDAMRYGIVGLDQYQPATSMQMPWFQNDDALYARLNA